MAIPACAQEPVQLYAFSCSNDNSCKDGFGPQSLIQASDGNLYGTTRGGGLLAYGTIFKLTPSGEFTLLHTFKPVGDGAYPGTLVEGSDGNLYGATAGGGLSKGVIFKISKAGTGFAVLYEFPEGFYFVEGSLSLVIDGTIYGSSIGGGVITATCISGCGTIFSFDPATGAFSTLYQLNGSTDGFAPSSLSLASDGNLYGTTEQNVFRVTPAGAFSVVADLPSPAYNYGSGVIQATNGNLYGTVNNNGPGLFEVALDGSGLQIFPPVYSLGNVEGTSALLQPTDGNLWFTTYPGAGLGVIVSLSPSNGSQVESITFSTDATPLIQATNGILYGTAQGGEVKPGHANGQVYSLNIGLP